MDLGKVGTKPTNYQSPPPKTPPSSGGSQPLAKFTVQGEGGSPVTISITKTDQTFTKAEVNQVRTAFKEQFGEIATRNAFRLIDQTLREDGTGLTGKDKDVITGGHILSANLNALAFMAPGMRFEAEINQAKSSLKLAEDDLKTATEELKNAKQELEDAYKETGNGLHDGPFYQPIMMRGDSKFNSIETAKQKIETATKKMETANEQITSSKEKLSEATKNLETFKQSMKEPFGDEDLTTLKNSVSYLKGNYERALSNLDDKKFDLEVATSDRDRAQEMHKDATYDERQKIDLKGKQEDYSKALKEFRTARQDVEKARGLYETAQNRLDAMQNGPLLRQFQSALDHVGSDPRFVQLLESNSPGKMSGGGLGTLEKIMSRQTLSDTVFGVIPGFSMAKAFKQAGDLGVSGGMLERSTKFMDDTPFAKMLATTLSKAQESESNKLGIQGTLAYVSFAMSFAKGSLTSMAMAPLGELIKGRIEHTTGHMFGESMVGTFVSTKVTDFISDIPTKIVDKIVDTGQETGLEKLTELPETPEDLEKMQKDIDSLKELESMGMPMIHVTPFTGTHPGRDLPLSDRDVAISFLMYLGPKEDPNPPSRLAEQRRLEIREKFFGAKPEDDYTSGIKLRGEDDLRSTLYGSVTASKTVPRGTNALHLMMSSLNLTKDL